MNQQSNIIVDKQRKAVGGIIGGAILAAILFTAVYVYFFVILQAQTTKGQKDAQYQALNNDKRIEVFKADSYENKTDGRIYVHINNTGTVPTKIAYISIYNNQSQPLIPPTGKKSYTINGGGSQVFPTGLAANYNLRYRIDAISERGNIASTPWPPQKIDFQLTPTIIQNITNIAQSIIINGIGSVQLDFRSFGVISPAAAPVLKDNVDQRGWDVKFGNATGYPAFRLPNSPSVFVLRVRNLDPSLENITLYSSTGFGVSLFGQNGNQSPVAYICKADENLNTLFPYNEKLGSRKVVLPNAAGANATQDTGWVNLFFCTDNPGGNSGAFTPSGGKTTINPVFIISRGEFDSSHRQYGQTIPYQAVTVTDSGFSACLKTNNLGACNNLATDNYRASKSAPQETVWVRVSSGAPWNTTATWFNPNGTTVKLGSTFNAINPFSFIAPTAGTPPGDYIIQVVDKNDDIYSMTYRIDP